MSTSVPEAEPPNVFFARWASLLIRRRWAFIALTVGLVVGSGWLIADRLRVDTSIEAFARDTSGAQTVLEAYRDEFGRDSAFMVIAEGDVFSVPYLERLRALHDELAALDMEIPSLGERKADRERRRRGEPAAPVTAPPAAEADPFADDGDDWDAIEGGTMVEETLSILNARRTQSSAGSIEVGEWLDPIPEPAELPALRAAMLAEATLVGQVLGSEGRHSMVLVRTQFMNEADGIRVNRRIAAIAAKHDGPGFTTNVVGMQALSDSINTLMMGDLKRMLIISVVLMIGLLGFMFRNVIGVLVPLAVVGVAAVNTFAMMAVFDMPVTMITNILPAFLFCVGLGDSIHLISVYRDGLREGMDGRAAVIHAVSHTGMPVLFTSLTTMVGLLSFRLASLEAIQEMGIAGAFGVFMAMVHSLVILPAVLSFNTKSRFGVKPAGEPDRLDRFLAWCNAASGVRGDEGRGPAPAGQRRRRTRTLALGGAIVALSILGITTLHVYHNPLSWMPEDTPIRQNMELVDREIGGTASVNLLIDGPSGAGLRDRALLVGLDALRAHIVAYRDPEQGAIVGNTISVLDVVKETWRALNGGDAKAYTIPDTQRGVTDALFLFENAGPDELRKLATNDLSRGQMTIRIKWLEAMSYKPLQVHIAAGIAQHIPEGSRVQPTGSVYTLITTVSSIIGDLLKSFGTAFLAITLIMMLLLRSLKLGLIAMVPNLMPIGCIMAFMGFSGIPIDLNNLLIASIAIGIAVDDTIHFLHHFRLHHDRSGNVEEAIAAAMRHSGRAMASTTLILMVGFFAYMGAAMANIVRFGLLVGLTALVALLIDLIITPALLRVFYARAPRTEEA